ncbi:hypothetical protein DMA11_19155 [Marinilabiliaceae bacterium JC017]|nr:hypothetical protein DMA11_19155 [Marinilabiliaceae bacterium JC017]
MLYNITKNIGSIENSRRCIFLLLFFFLNVVSISAQQDALKEKKYSLELQLIANTGFNNKTFKYNKYEYNVRRTLIDYQQYLSGNFKFCLAGDTYVKKHDKPYHLTPYLKRAYFQFHNKRLSLSAGLLVLEQFKYQRKIWQLRYVDKTFQNKFKYGENRNVGILMKHHLSSRFSYDIAIISGYNTPIKKSLKKYQVMMGQTFNTDFCTFRLFNSISLESAYEYTFSFFVAKVLRNSKVGVEYAKKISNNKRVDVNKYGISAFGNHSFSKSMMCFVRYDMNKESMKRQAKNVIWSGIQYTFNKNIKASIYYEKEGFDTVFYGLTIYIHHF